MLYAINGVELTIIYKSKPVKPDYTKSERANKISSKPRNYTKANYNRKCKQCKEVYHNSEIKLGLCPKCRGENKE